MSHIVWSDWGSSNWTPSDPLETLDDVLAYVVSDQCPQPTPMITKLVTVKLVDADEPPKPFLTFPPDARAAVIGSTDQRFNEVVARHTGYPPLHKDEEPPF